MKAARSAWPMLAVALAMILPPGIARAAQAEESQAAPSGSIDLAGAWQFRLDPGNAGEKEKWFEQALPDKIKLPGSTDEAGYGTRTTTRSPWNLSRVYEYVGPAWYQKEVDIPGEWKGKHITLFLERAHWETRVWVDSQPVGMEDSLSAPHQYDLSSALAPGKHRLTIRVDNTCKINVGKDAHSVCEHTQTNWNGLIGRLELRAADPVWVEDVQVYPDVKAKRAKVRVAVGNATGQEAKGTLTLSAEGRAEGKLPNPPTRVEFTASKAETTVEAEYNLGEHVLLWNEFDPMFYRLRVALEAQAPGACRDAKEVEFGLREFRAQGTQFTMNGRPTFLRGTLECCIFPLTGYPDMNMKGWERILRVARSYGLNHIRFHSWCPPEAAFAAADRLGFLLHVEAPVWTVLGDDPKVDAFVYAESDRILRAYGNHPSFCMLCVGNEPSGSKMSEFLTQIVGSWKAKDPRRLYTTCSGWPILPVSDYNSTPDPRGTAWGAGLSSRFNSRELSTEVDYRDFIARFRNPTVSHEIGQYCAFPNLKEIAKYTGVLRARNFELVRESLEKNHMLDQAEDFLMASGKLQALLYKEEIEAALRTPGFGGFQLLDLHDFPGQGTALVGVLDAFWDSKGYVTPAEHRRYCCETVPLLRMKKVVYTADETFTASAEVAHFGPVALGAGVTWSMATADGKKVASGELPALTIPVGNGTKLGEISVPLSDVAAPAKLIVTLSLAGRGYSLGMGCANDWDIWVYPPKIDTQVPRGVRVADRLDEETVAALKAGGKAVLLARPGTVRSNVPPGFASIFWNTQWTGGQPPHTLGILCNPKHPALAAFPTEFHSNWQWWDLVSKSRAMILNDLPPDLRPIVQVIDDWNKNRRLGLVFEARVGQGKLLVSSIDLASNLASRPVARQMLYSLLKYVDSPAFAPTRSVDLELVKDLFNQPSAMTGAKVVKVDSEEPGYEGAKAIDGDPATMWHTAFSSDLPAHPHEIVVDLGQQAAIKGFSYLPRQDGNPNGTIGQYEFYVSADGKVWGGPVAQGTFAADTAEKRVLFAEPRTGRFIRLVALSEIKGQKFASAAELSVITEPTKAR